MHLQRCLTQRHAMDLSEYVLIEKAAHDRVRDLRRARRATPSKGRAMATLARLVHVASVLRDEPRAIDSYIDYFGNRVPSRR
jgi:hypothetical protein